MCGSMVGIQSAMAENRRGKKAEEEETTGWKYNVRICFAGGHKQCFLVIVCCTQWC